MARKVQRYIKTDDPQAFETIIGAQHQIGEYPFGDGQIPFVKMQTVDGDSLSVLPISTRLLDALHRWNRNHTPKFDFTVYHSEDGGLLQQSEVQSVQSRPMGTQKKKPLRKGQMPMMRRASMIPPHTKRVS